MKSENKPVRARIAPSPTGPLHVGTARSALFNFVFARQHRGVFVLRIEDTDIERSNPLFEQDIKDGLNWLGLNWDEFYKQSERLDIYEKYLKKLFDSGHIFWCPHSEEELAAERREQMIKKEPPLHVCSSRNESGKKIAEGGILRFKNDAKDKISFNDIIRGKISFDPKLIGDFSVAKDFNSPLYNFAVAIDDHETAISHVIRGEDHISNTPKQILLQNALGFKCPHYAHLPLILGTDRSKLSKRHGATSVLEYQKSGYLPEAMVNFMILLGWRPASSGSGKGKPEKEIFSMEEILSDFSLDRVQKSGAVFNIDKLNWMNGEYIKKADLGDLAAMLKTFCPALLEKIEADRQKWEKITALLRERLTVLGEAGEMADYFYEEPYYPREVLFWKENQPGSDIVRHLAYILTVLTELDLEKWSKKALEGKIMPYADKEGRGEVLWPFRTALSGKRASPGPFDIAEVIGRDQTMERIQKAIKLLS